MGIAGFLLFCGWSLGVSLILGGAWLAAAPGERVSRLWIFAWARMTREAAADLLPFSQLGGILVGARTLTAAGVRGERVYGSMVVDMTTEMAAQAIYTIFGLAMMASLFMGDGAAVRLRPLILGGTGLMIAIILAFFVFQRAALDFTSRVAARFLPKSAPILSGVRDELVRIYRRRDRVALAFFLNLAAWIGSGLGAWIVLNQMDVPVSVWGILSLESLIFTLRGVAFAIPGGIGVQEAAYAIVGPLFGIPAESALALSLAKRARDIVVGLPTLIAWQVSEARKVTSRAAA